MTFTVIYEGDEQQATENYLNGATPSTDVTYIVINDKTVKLNIDGVEQVIDVSKYKNDGIFESEFSS